MAVSKRLRYEILRRDNHACRYCGAAAPDVILTVDHVLAVALGGTDKPENLVAACKDCNAGKSSASPDNQLLQDVSQDALRWAKAIAIVAKGRAVHREELRERYDQFSEWWNHWKIGKGSNSQPVPIGAGWRNSIDQFIDAGLEMEDLEELIHVAMGSKCQPESVWRYFCGCCWRRIEQAQEHAKAIVEHWEASGRG